MCGKFTRMASWAEIVEYQSAFGVAIAHDNEILTTPMRGAPVIFLDPNGDRVVKAMRWGLPDLHKMDFRVPKHMHARCETIDKLPTFAEAFRLRRGIVLTKTFNEGEEIGNKTRQWKIKPKDNKPIPVAVIFEEVETEEGLQRFFVMCTTKANGLIEQATKQDRMPAIMPQEDWEIWLGETRAPLEDVQALLRTYERDDLWDIAPEEKPPSKPKSKPTAAPAKPPEGDLFS